MRCAGVRIYRLLRRGGFASALISQSWRRSGDGATDLPTVTADGSEKAQSRIQIRRSRLSIGCARSRFAWCGFMGSCDGLQFCSTGTYMTAIILLADNYIGGIRTWATMYLFNFCFWSIKIQWFGFCVSRKVCLFLAFLPFQRFYLVSPVVFERDGNK